MKLVIAQMKHETNTFSPVPTPLARFARGPDRPLEGEAIRAAFRGTGTAIGAFLELADKAGAQAVLPVAVDAAPSGPVATNAFEWMATRILDAGLDNAAAFAICDPQAVERIKQAGTGARVTLPLGGKLDMPALKLRGEPREVSGIVKRIVDGRFVNDGSMAKGAPGDMGSSAVLDTGRIEIAVISRHTEPYDIASFRALGIDPAKKRYLMLKSRVHWRAGLGGLAKAVVECAGTGVCTSDCGTLDFRRVRRPIYPLDETAHA